METAQNILEIVKKIPRQYIFPLLFALAGLILFGYGLIAYLHKDAFRENQIQPQDFTISSAPRVEKVVKIDVEGAVVHPGVFTVDQNARVADGLIAAGGLSSDADRDYVAKHINLSAILMDGTKVYIPQVGEASVPSQSSAQSATDTTVLGSNVLNINDATADSLDSLPGIGPVTAQKIIAGRPYTSVDDLLTKKVVNSKVFNQIKDLVIAQ